MPTYSALLHVEERIFVKLPHSGSVTAFHVIHIDNELRLGKRARCSAEADASACLLRICSRCSGTYFDKPFESSYSLFVKYLLKQLSVSAMRGSVRYLNGISDFLLARSDDDAEKLTLGTLSRKVKLQGVVGLSACQTERADADVSRVGYTDVV